ncbi:hypothetical protein [Sphingopyxis panaciterrae]
MTPTVLISKRIARAGICLAAIGPAAPAAAEDVQQIVIEGNVAPRCWVADPAKSATHPVASATRGRAICNQAPPVLLSAVRIIDPDGALAKPMPATADRPATPSPISPRTALEIVVSPQP